MSENCKLIKTLLYVQILNNSFLRYSHKKSSFLPKLQMLSQQTVETDELPWPNLSDIVSFKCFKRTRIVMICKLCEPKPMEISGFHNIHPVETCTVKQLTSQVSWNS